jgi:hypothetical protein
VEKPRVEMAAPDCVAVALVRTFQPLVAPRLVTAEEPVEVAAADASSNRCGDGCAVLLEGLMDSRRVVMPAAIVAVLRLLALLRIARCAPCWGGGADERSGFLSTVWLLVK